MVTAVWLKITHFIPTKELETSNKLSFLHFEGKSYTCCSQLKGEGFLCETQKAPLSDQRAAVLC